VSVVGFATTATAVADGGVAIISLSEASSCGGFGEAESFRFRRAWAGLIFAGRSSFANPVRYPYYLSNSSGARSSLPAMKASEANSLTPAAWFKARAAKATRPADRS